MAEASVSSPNPSAETRQEFREYESAIALENARRAAAIASRSGDCGAPSSTHKGQIAERDTRIWVLSHGGLHLRDQRMGTVQHVRASTMIVRASAARVITATPPGPALRRPAAAGPLRA